ncbi:MAG: hypothetical protein JW829_06710 [Pirellulales bacterium]|nr:hypothetical protein [Pirellulales bacterium]
MIGNRQLAAPSLGLVGMCLLGLSAGGCYDGEALVTQAEAKASREMQEEIDLGKYSVTLPRSTKASTTVTLELHLFANVAKRDVPKIKKQLNERMPILRHETIMKLRQAAAEELSDPSLATLRSSIMEVTRQTLPAVPIESISFYRIGVVEE